MRSSRLLRSSRIRVSSGLVLLTLLGLIPQWLDNGEAYAQGNSEKKPERDLVLELRLPKREFIASDPLKLEVRFRNTGHDVLKLPMIDGPQKILFFDFLIVGDTGTEHLTRHADGWGDPDVKPVELVSLAPGQIYNVRLGNLSILRDFDAGVHPNEKYKIQCIYRDHSYGHSATYEEYGKNDPSVWKGIVISAPETINSIKAARPAP